MSLLRSFGKLKKMVVAKAMFSIQKWEMYVPWLDVDDQLLCDNI